MKTNLEQINDYEVVITNDEKSIIEQIEETSPDVLILDFIISGVGASYVLSEIQKKNLTASTIVLTPTKEDFVLDMLFKNGASYVIVEPINPHELLWAVQEVSTMKFETSEKESTISEYVLTGVNKNDLLDESDTIEYMVHLLHELGIPAHIKGYQYIKESLMMSLENIDILNRITKELYPTIAKKYQSTGIRVERAIRHAIDVAWKNGNPEFQDKLFAYTVSSNGSGRPTNSEFIAMLVDHIRLKKGLL